MNRLWIRRRSYWPWVPGLAFGIWTCSFAGAGLDAAEEHDEELIQQLRRLEREQEAQREALRRQELEIDRLRDQIGGQKAERSGSSATEAPAATGTPFQPPGIWAPRGDTSVTQFDLPKYLSLGFGMQYRLLYNASNIPGPADTSFSDPEPYDFLSQRLRLNLAVAPKGVPVGGFVQTEFRGGFGGSSPTASDSRDEEPTLNPFNRLQARGIRYGYLFAEPVTEQRFLAGILPLSDELGDTLFSADWDFNVGGIAYLGACGASNYRLAYLELVEGVGASDEDMLGDDGTFLIADYVHNLEALRVGVHAYYLSIAEGLPLGDTEELWIGPSVGTRLGSLNLRAFGVVNVGRLGEGTLDDEGHVVSGYRTNDGHTGFAVKLEASHPVGASELSVQTLYSSGDPEDDVQGRFVTPQGLLGTQGYWGYTHLFTANPPSDVNDLGLELGNAGAGLFTLQGRARVPLLEQLRGEVAAGWFLAPEERNGTRDMGVEVGGLLTWTIHDSFQIDFGGAGAFLGEFLGVGAESLYEVFTRIQFQL